MKIKMIVCDMDGTLLNSDGEISKKTRNILLKLQEKGIKVVLASGRGYFRLIKYAKELKLDEFEGYLIDENGTSIINDYFVLPSPPISNSSPSIRQSSPPYF